MTTGSTPEQMAYASGYSDGALYGIESHDNLARQLARVAAQRDEALDMVAKLHGLLGKLAAGLRARITIATVSNHTQITFGSEADAMAFHDAVIDLGTSSDLGRNGT